MHINFFSTSRQLLEQVPITVDFDNVLVFGETKYYAEAEAALCDRREEGFCSGMCKDENGKYYMTWTIEGDLDD